MHLPQCPACGTHTVGEPPVAGGGLQGSSRRKRHRAAEAESLRGWRADPPACPPFIQEINVLCLAADVLGLLIKAVSLQDNRLCSVSSELDLILSLCPRPDHAGRLALHLAFAAQLPQSMMTVGQEHFLSVHLLHFL